MDKVAVCHTCPLVTRPEEYGRTSDLLEALEEVLDGVGALTTPSEFPNCLGIDMGRGQEILSIIRRAKGEA